MAKYFPAAARLQGLSATPPTYPFTMACWFNCDVAATSDAQVLLAYSAATGIGNIWALLARSDASDTLRFGCDGGVGFTQTGSVGMTYTEGVWNHALATGVSATDRNCYLNGPDNTDADSTNRTPSCTEIDIGRDTENANNDFEGSIAHCAVWDHASVVLDASEIAALAAGVSPLLIRPHELIFYAPLNTPGTTDYDHIGGLTLDADGSITLSDNPPIFMPVSQEIFTPPPLGIQMVSMSGVSWI